MAAIDRLECRRALAATGIACQCPIRGVKIGDPKLEQRGVASNKANADRFAASVMPVTEQINASGATSLRGLYWPSGLEGGAGARRKRLAAPLLRPLQLGNQRLFYEARHGVTGR